jgi:exopolysaccharide biosynthesis predicted pyruvyltransferase EpsI
MAKILSQGKILIVDRLHACIGSMLIGKRVIFVDQSYLKINRTLSTAFATSTSCTLENMRISRAENADDAFNQAVKELNTKQYFN